MVRHLEENSLLSNNMDSWLLTVMDKTNGWTLELVDTIILDFAKAFLAKFHIVDWHWYHTGFQVNS